MKIWPTIIPVNDNPPKFGAAILYGEPKAYNVLAARYDFDTRHKAIKWVNKNFYRMASKLKDATMPIKRE